MGLDGLLLVVDHFHIAELVTFQRVALHHPQRMRHGMDALVFPGVVLLAEQQPVDAHVIHEGFPLVGGESVPIEGLRVRTPSAELGVADEARPVHHVREAAFDWVMVGFERPDFLCRATADPAVAAVALDQGEFGLAEKLGRDARVMAWNIDLDGQRLFFFVLLLDAHVNAP